MVEPVIDSNSAGLILKLHIPNEEILDAMNQCLRGSQATVFWRGF